MGEKIIETLRDITHIEGGKGSLPLALGIRDGSIDLGISLKSDGDHEKLTIRFPD